MDIEEQTITISSNNPQNNPSLLPSQKYNIIPAKSKQQVVNGKVNQYFNNLITSPQHNLYEVSLQGNAMKGKPLSTEHMYEAVLMKEGNNVDMTLLRRVEEMIEWRKDRLWSENDGRVRLIQKHIQIQNALHQ